LKILKNRCGRLLVLSLLVAAQFTALAPAAYSQQAGKESLAVPAAEKEAGGLTGKEKPVNQQVSKTSAAKEHDKKKHPAEKEKLEAVTAKIKILAPPNVVWQVVHEERKHDPDLAYSKVITEGNNEFLLEQKFCLIPVIGTSVCQMQQKETPDCRIDYKLIKSDRFKVMEGSWVLIPSSDKQSTTLELTTTLDLGMPVPQNIINHVTLKKLERRLHHIKQMAEKECHHSSLAETKKDVY
jgi:hypothetical protein